MTQIRQQLHKIEIRMVFRARANTDDAHVSPKLGLGSLSAAPLQRVPARQRSASRTLSACRSPNRHSLTSLQPCENILATSLILDLSCVSIMVQGSLVNRQESSIMASKKRVLVINPNTTEAMTNGLKPLISPLRDDRVSQHISLQQYQSKV